MTGAGNGRILVTGSSGTLGTRLCERLLERGADLVGADRRGNRWREDIDRLTIRIDLCDDREVGSILPDDISTIVHLAANARVPHSVGDPRLARENMVSLFNLLEYARDRGIDRILFGSSQDVYGSRPAACREEEVDPGQVESPYAASKIAGEALLHGYRKCYGIDHVIMRFSGIYGRYDEEDRLIPIFVERATAGEDLIVNGTGKELDLIFIDDAVEGILLGLDRFEKIRNMTVNIGSGRTTGLLDLARIIIRIGGGRSRIVPGENPPGDALRCILDITRARELLGFEPVTDLESGIERYLDWRRRRG